MSHFPFLDWWHDDGINLPMINDVIRNQFYDRLLSRYVRKQHCVDIGFGTGLLSLLAIKHGAESITAYEKDPQRFELGRYVIEKLGLEDRISIKNKTFSINDFDDCKSAKVFFSEIVDSHIFGEGLWHVIPRSAWKDRFFLPNRYRVEIWSCAISDSVAQGIDKNVYKFGDLPGFNPGVDIDNRFVELLNGILHDEGTDQNLINHADIILPGIRPISPDNSNDWGNNDFWQHLTLTYGEISAIFELDTNKHNFYQKDKFFAHGKTSSIDHSNDGYSLTIDMSRHQEKNVLLWPRMSIGDDHDRLYLDRANWLTLPPTLAVNYHEDIIVKHSFTDGFFEIR